MKLLNNTLTIIIACFLANGLIAMETPKKPAISKEQLTEYLRKGISNPIKIEIPNKTKNLIVAAYKNGNPNEGTYGFDGIAPNGTLEMIYGLTNAQVPFPQIIMRSGLNIYVLDFQPQAGPKGHKAILLKSPTLTADEPAAAAIINQKSSEAQAINLQIMAALINRTRRMRNQEQVITSDDVGIGQRVTATIKENGAELNVDHAE